MSRVCVSFTYNLHFEQQATGKLVAVFGLEISALMVLEIAINILL